MLASSSALASDYVIAISSQQSSASAEIQKKALIRTLSQMALGTETALIDGENTSLLCTFKVPNNANYNSPKAKLKANIPCIKALNSFVQERTDKTTASSHALRVPQLLRFIAQNFDTDGIELILLGSPFYQNTGEAAVSMLDARIPSDGHINAHRSASVFGTKGQSKALSGLRIHYAYPPNTQILNDQHNHFLSRFWTLYLEAMGATLVSFQSDTNTVIQRALNNARTLQHDYVLDESAKLEMLRIRPQTPDKPIYERSISEVPLSKWNVKQAKNVEIAVRWDCKACDLDIYARPWDNAPIIYFGKISTAQGNFWKDFTNSPHASNAWETISFNVPLDLSKLLIGVNFYDGVAPDGINGEVRVSVYGATYAKSFVIAANEGNSAKGMTEAFATGKALNPQSLLFHPLDIVPLAEQ